MVSLIVHRKVRLYWNDKFKSLSDVSTVDNKLMAPPRRPGLTIETLTAPPGDPMTLLFWTAVPVELCNPSMLEFRKTTDVLRVSDNATRGGEEMPVSNHPDNPTLQRWQAGGVAIFGYGSSRTFKYARHLLERVYITETGGIAVRRR